LAVPFNDYSAQDAPPPDSSFPPSDIDSQSSQREDEYLTHDLDYIQCELLLLKQGSSFVDAGRRVVTQASDLGPAELSQSRSVATVVVSSVDG
jgi:hypothetical protein